MAPALTETVSHRQSKISSPAQTSSPRPIIGDITEQTQTTNATNLAQNHLANNQTNGSADDSYSPSKELNLLNDSQKMLSTIQPNQLGTVFCEQTANGPCLGPLFATHMDQSTNDEFEQPKQTQNDQQSMDIVSDPSTDDLLNAIADTANGQQSDCGNLNAIQTTVEELLAQTQTQEFQQQFQQDFLQQSNQVPSQTFDLTQFPTDNVQTMDLLMADDQSQQTSGASAMHSTITSSPISSQMQQNFLRENAEMEQMLGDLTGTEIDLMQVLKCFESTPAGENLGDLAGGLSLFNDVDVMNIGLEDVVTASVSKESRAQDLLTEVEAKRAKITRECDFMMRRLRKIQARHMGRHTSEEIGGLYEYTQQLIKRKERETKSISTMTPLNQLHSDKHKLSSASSWKSLLKRIEHAATNQQSSSTSMKILLQHSNSSTIDHHHVNNVNNFSASSSTVGGVNASQKPSVITCVPTLDPNGSMQLKQCAGLLSTELSMVNRTIDSDATASSSGGDSADEGTSYNNGKQYGNVPIAQRAAYRRARDRAKIASRWTWLLAQISDLEYRISQHQELYYLLRKNNGPVQFEEEPVDKSSIEPGSMQQDQLPQQLSVNGCRNPLSNNMRLGDLNDGAMKMFGADEVVLDGSARTRAFKPNEFIKRKLLQSTNLHKISRRAARPCTIKCGCRWPVHPCLLCTGRTDPTAPRDLPDMMSTQESVALLDPCFHPILSFPEDVAQNIHIESTLRQPDFQTRVARVSTKAIIKGALAMQKASERDQHRNGPGVPRKNSETHPTINSKKLSPKKLKLSQGKLKKQRNNNNTIVPVGGRKMKKSLQSRYDIDNIVIPRNMSTTTIEVLSYKEIPTPKWRVIEDDDDEPTTASQKPENVESEDKSIEQVEQSGPEDISSDAYAQRHEKSWAEERKRFETFLKFPYSTRPKHERRRTVSFKKGYDTREDLLRRSTTPDVKDTIPPYEPLAFPLTVDTLEDMIQCMPTSYKDIINECLDQVGGVDGKTQAEKQTTSTSKAIDNKTTTITTTLATGNARTQNRTEHYSELAMLVEDSDETESIPDEDPDDPEFEPTPAKRMLKGL